MYRTIVPHCQTRSPLSNVDSDCRGGVWRELRDLALSLLN